mgnify:CR=1 FL=1|tara:strand:- start:2737 stop:3489 length:753 start_codon:yes stop_codon:yes gene_type:complete
MAQPNSRQTLIDYCLRRLGSPVLEINVDDDQVQDRIDDTLAKYREFHSDALVKVYLKHQMTSDDITNMWVPIASDIPYVSKVFPLNPTYNNVNMFDIRYQMMLNSMGDFLNFAGGMSYYYQMNQYLDFLDDLLTGEPITTFSRNQGRLYIHGNIEDGDIKEGQFIVMEAWQFVDHDEFTSVWNDTFMKDYATAQIKRQWGENMMKFEGMQLPGGVLLNGRQYYDDATAEIERLEEKMRAEYELPVDFFMG